MAKLLDRIEQRLPQNRRKRKLMIIIEVELLAVLLIIFGIVAVRNAKSMRVDAPITYQDTAHVDVIDASNGRLSVNDVSIDVPTESAEYTISYGWSEMDEDYPTVPLVGTVSYKDANGSVLYEISLYKDIYYEKDDIPEGKTVDNWFDSWSTDEGRDVVQEAYTANGTAGIRITSIDRSGGYSGTYAFYFVTQRSNGDIVQYVIEGTCRDAASQDTFTEVMTASIDSLNIQKEEDQIGV